MLQRIEGFDTFSETTTNPQDLLEKGLGYVTGSSAFSYVDGKYAGKAIRMDAAADQVWVPLAQPVDNFFIGFWFRTNALPGTSDVIASIRPMDDLTIFHLSLSLDSSGNLTLFNSGGALGASSGGEIVIDEWTFIEVSGTIHDSTGTGIVKVNQTEVVNVTAQDTLNNTTSEIGAIFLHGYAGGNADFDDLYIVDTTVVGDEPITFLGYITIATVFPVANGTTNNFAVTGAASNYEAVDEINSDDDTSYVASTTAGHIETYLAADLNVAYNGSTVLAVTTTARVRKDGPAYKAVRLHISTDDGASLDTGATEGLSGEYRYLESHKSFADPATSAPWEIDGITNLYLMTEIVT